jgi:hypothetical protein
MDIDLIFSSTSPGQSIDVFVGPDGKQFIVPPRLLLAHSQYFRLAYGRSSIEALTGVFVLFDDNACVFDMFVQWLYCNKVSFDAKAADADMLLIEAWLFGHKRGCPEFQNAIIDAMHSSWTTGYIVRLATLELAFTQAKPGSALALFLADKMAWQSDPQSLLRQVDLVDVTHCPEYPRAVLRALLERISLSEGENISTLWRHPLRDMAMFRSRYHVH